ncbi:DNA polymerase III subunit gamma/tau, partial [bacterium]|nr:DNA polymerase III subunit gamma/tau [bacterium]
YKVLARKYRPKNFDEVCGQKHTVESLKNAIKTGRIAHAYIFAGPRGVGKTSVARIFSKSLNCVEGPTVNPCNKCDICREISSGSCIDVLEIDGASNRGIDEIRNLRENVNLRPSKARFKIYIIDEVHMLTNEAFNALLKTLEEPPEYVKFIFATTSPEKILPTILSRCQRFDFKPLTLKEVSEEIKRIAKEEKIEVEDDVIKEIFDFSGGSLRDALSILDQLIVFSEGNKIKYDDVKKLLGLPEEKSIEEILKFIRKKQPKESISLFHQLLSDGKNPGVILDNMIRKLRDIGLQKIGEITVISENKEFASLFEEMELEKILESISLVVEYKEKLRRETQPLIVCEILLLKLSQIMGRETEKVEKKEERKEEEESIFNFVEEKKENKKEEEKQKKTEKIEEKKDQQKNEKEQSSQEKVEEKKKEPLDDEKIKQLWSVALKELKRHKPTVEAALREGQIEKIEDEVIFISFEEKFSFHKSMAEKPTNKKYIEKVVSKIFGKEYRINLILKEGKKNSILDSEQVKKIIKLFNGEVIEIKE